MKHCIVTLTLAGLLAVPAGLSAQEHQHDRQEQPDKPQQQMMHQRRMGMGQHGMHGMMGMMGAMDHGPRFILRQKEALSLNESQVERLEALQKQLVDARETHMERVEPLHTQAMEALQADEPDLGEYESALRNLAEHHVETRMDAARISLQSLEVLTPEQRSNVRYAMRLMSDMMRHGMTGHGMMMQRGMMGDGGMMGMAGMMGGCPMMESMGEEGG